MDILAAVKALKAPKRSCRVRLYNPNGYLIDAMSKGWATRWRTAGWVTGEGKPTAHSDLWNALLKLCAVHRVEFLSLPTEGIEEYGLCQRLASKVIAEQVRQVDQARAGQIATPDRGRPSDPAPH
jgi:ribonuclease HI